MNNIIETAGGFQNFCAQKDLSRLNYTNLPKCSMSWGDSVAQW